MRAWVIIAGIVIVLAGAGFIALLIYGDSIQSDQGEVRIELEDTFPE